MTVSASPFDDRVAGAHGGALVLYDVDCGFCRWCVGLVLAWDRAGRLCAAPIQGELGDALLAELPERARLRSWHLVDAAGRVWSGGAALAPLGRLLPRGRILSAAAGLSPGATEWAYRLVGEHRGFFSRFVPAASKRRADERIRLRAAEGRR
jgi:predicted DCC family thiol-disulfide oxidoreductase YuxK